MTNYFDFWRLLAGLSLFLFGMQQLETSLKLLAGKSFKRFLRRTTQKPISSVFSGIIATVLVQSSSLVGLIVLALVGAGVIPLMNAIGVVIGANLGTTSPFTRFLEAWIKDDKTTTCYYISDVPVDVTDVALEALTKECLHLIFDVAHLNLRFLSICPSDSIFG